MDSQEQKPIAVKPESKTNVLCIVSLVTGILAFLSICLAFIPVLGAVCTGIMGLSGLAGIITGFIGMNQIKQNFQQGKGMAIAGIVLGILSLIALCLVLVIPPLLGPSIDNIFNDILSNLGGY